MIDLLIKSTPIKTAYSLAKGSGVDVFLVGGSVRDLHITGSLSSDLDFLVTAQARPIAEQFAQASHGAAFCLDKKRAYYRAVRPDDKTITTADFSSLLEGTLFQNLLNRDFTINSIGISLADVFEKRELTFIDPSNGLKDLREKRIRITSTHSLRDDPLRILRALRFRAKYHFNLDPSTESQISDLKTQLLACSWERIRNEFFLILAQPDSSESLAQLDRQGILSLLLPECDSIEFLKQKDNNGASLSEHTLQTIYSTELILAKIHTYFPEQAASLRDYFNEEIEGGIQRGPLLIFAALLYNLYYSGQAGIVKTRPSNNYTNHLKRTIRKITRRFKLSRHTERTITAILTYSAQPAASFPSKAIPERSIFRFMKDIDGPVPDTLILALALDLAANFDPKKETPALPDGETIQALMRYYFQEFSQKRPAPLLTGNDIMRILDLKPGKKVGDVLEMVKTAEREGTISSKEEALQLLISAAQKK